MTIDHYPRPRSRPGRAVAGFGALALLGTGLLVVPGASAAPVDTFATSFEADEAAAAVSTALDAPVNVTGQQLDPGSLTPFITAVTARGQNAPGETAARAADGDRSTKWLDFSRTSWLRYDLDSAQVVTSYQLTSADDAPGRDPRDFALQGSNDGGTTWTPIDTRTGQAWAQGSQANRGVTKTYEVTGAEAYTSYRLEITANNGEAIIQLAELQLLGESDGEPQLAPITTEPGNGPVSSPTAKTGVGASGLQALRYGGSHVADGPATATNTLFDVEIAVQPGSELTYDIFPVLGGDLDYPSTYAAVDLVFDDGSRLSTSGATDRNGYGASARAQGQADVLFPDQWNSIRVDLTPFVGRTIETVAFGYDNPDGAAGTLFSGWLDDITVEQATTIDDADGLVSYVDTRRGSNSSSSFSRGLTFPAAAWPNGFNFFTPMTDAGTTGTLYEWQRRNNADNLPELQGIGISHQPSIWMGDRNQLAILPASGVDPTSTLADRALAFRHENEVGRPDLYQVEFENGITTAVTPTDHGGIYRFTFPDETGSVLVDQVSGDSGLTVASDGAVSGWVDGGSGYPGRTRMFVAGQFDATPTDARATSVGNRNSSARFAAFDTATDDTVELRLATSFISQDQAARNLDLEVTGRTFEDVQTDVTRAWNERLGVLEVEGASQQQLVTAYSTLYRLNLYPNSQFENTGTADEPVHRYASPVSPTQGQATATQTNAQIKDGKIYVNNGFWDTYRTVWPMYSMLYPELAEELVDGFAQQYRDGGWIARWSSPGYADLMTGTSSDVAFADSYLAGALGTNLGIDAVLDAYDAAVKNATVLPPSNNVGRKGLETSIFQGWTQEGTHESASWGLEGYINDFGIAQMAAELAADPRTPADRVATLTEEAEYFDARSKNYVTMFNPEANTFTARYRNGDFAAGADFDKLAWGGAFTEASAWTFGFHAPFDVDGLAALYGGRDGLVDVLDEFMATPEVARSSIHEAYEARDVRLGLLGMSNQVAHHIPYIYAAAGKPSKTQELVRDITKRLFVGSDIGQGYVGDEDNGEMSAWYLFSALGFYPLQVGSGDFTIGSPMFERATLNLPGGDLVVSAPGASQGSTYVAGVTFDGTPIDDVVLDGDLLRGGGELAFTMSDTPTTWGAKDLTEELEVPAVPIDATTPGFGTLTAADGTAVGALVDDDATTSVTFPGSEAVLTWTGGAPVTVDRYTLTDGEGGHPADWVLEASDDGETWVELDARADEEFPWDTQTRPFGVAEPAAHTSYRLTISSSQGPLVLTELELFATAGVADRLALTPLGDVTVAPGQEVTAPLATLVGPSLEAADYTVSVDYRDGTGPRPATLTANALGGFGITSPHALARAGVYDVLVSATLGEESVSTQVRVQVERDETLVGSFTTVCIGDLGRTAGSCDGQGYTFDRAKLADTGFVQGTTIDVGETGLSFDLPLVEPGRPDAVSNAGQTIALQLGDGATQVSFVGTANEGNKDLGGTLTYTDGTTQAVPMQFGDWVGASGAPVFGNVVVGTSNGRLSGVGAESTVKRTSVYATAPFTLATDDAGEPKQVRSLTLPTSTGEISSGRIHLMAVADDGDRSDLAALAVEPREVASVTAGTPFTAALADVTGGTGEATATVAWGDGGDLADAEVTDGVVTGGHTYAEAGTYAVTVTVDDGTLSRSVELEVVVTDDASWTPALEVSPASVAVGAPFTLTGRGFAPDETVTLTIPGDGPRELTAGEDGTFTTTRTLAAGTAPGTVTITARGAVSEVDVTVSLTVTEPAFTFADVPVGTQFRDEITWLAGRGVTTGWELPGGVREFRPVTPVARDAMAAFLYRLAGSPSYTAPTTSPFTDVTTDDQFYDEIAWLNTAGISTGWANGDGTFSFRPLEPVARDAMAAFLFRWAEVEGYQPPAVSAFTDVSPNNQFYREISWLAASEVATGWKGNDGTSIYRPLTSVNRDAMAAFMYRLDRLG